MITEKSSNKVLKELGQEAIAALEALNEDELKAAVVQAGQAIKTAVQELEANPKYVEVKELLTDIKSALVDVRKRQNAITQYALHLLEEKGKQ
jgi:ribosomal protein RSM22 (predicted rRNA methylase)